MANIPGKPNGGISNWLQANSDPLMALGLGLMSGGSPMEQITQGLSNFSNERKLNRTVQYLKGIDPELAAAAENNLIPVDAAYKLHIERKQAQQQAQLKAQEPNYMAVGKNLFDRRTGQWISPPAGMAGAEDADEWGLSPVWGKNAKGDTVLGQLSKTGKFKPLDTGDFIPTPGINNIDTGTEIITRNSRSGDTISVTPKELAETERQKGLGKSQGDAAATYQSMASKMPGLEKVVSDLDKLADAATYTWAGRALDTGMAQLGLDPRDAAVARAEYSAKVDNQILPLLKDTFGAQFTQKEGETLRATLGDADKTPAEKKAVLKAFIEQKRRDVEALALQGMNPGQGNNQGGATRTSSGLQWSVEP